MKLDILAFGAHPDDVELSCSGTMLSHMAMGAKAGIIDLTQGELGTRGSAALRSKEAAAASKILGIKVRENLKMKDGFIEINEKNLLKVITVIRKYRPEIILLNAVNDRHIDHGKGAELVHQAAFLSGLAKIKTKDKGVFQKEWRPKANYHYIQDYYIIPDVVVDITPWFDTKMKSVMAYESQFWKPGDNGPITPISTKDYLDFLNARAMQFGRYIGVKYGEGYTVKRPIGSTNLLDLK